MATATTSHLSNMTMVKWTVATVLGLSVGIGAAFVLGGPIESVVGMMLVTPMVTALAGSALGSSQWLVLRRVTSRGGWWIACTAVGLGVGLTLGIVLVEKISAAVTGEAVQIVSSSSTVRVVSFAAVGLCAGLGLGVTQWLYLRGRSRHAGRWLAFSSIGFMTGFALAAALAELLAGGVTTAAGLVVFLLLATTIVGVVTANGLKRLDVAT